MLTSISAPTPVAKKEESAAELLIGCHNRIRHFTAMSAALAEAGSRPLREIADAAQAIHRYFSVALPLHEADENESLHPRLHKAAPAAIAAAADEMVRQHLGIDVLVDELLPLWDNLQREPQNLPVLAPALRDKTTWLLQLWDEHLALEEQTVFPAMQQFLSPQELEAIRQEMHRRRAL